MAGLGFPGTPFGAPQSPINRILFDTFRLEPVSSLESTRVNGLVTMAE